MNIDELKAKKDEYITGLEKILKDWGKYLICPSDRKLIDATMLVVEGEYNSQLVVHNSTGKNDFTFKGNHKFDNVKSLIIAHAQNYKQTNTIKYKIDERFVSEEEMLKILNAASDNELSMLLDDFTTRLFTSCQRMLTLNQTLSSSQVYYVGEGIKELKELNDNVEKGYVYSKLILFEFDCAKKIVQYASTQKRSNKRPSNEQLINFWTNIIRDNGRTY